MTTQTKLLTEGKPGRPTKLTPQLQEKICKYIANGNYLSVACQAVGIDESTLFSWKKQGLVEATNGGGMYLEFLNATKEAEALHEAKIAERLLAAAMPGERKKVTKTGPDGVSVEVTETAGDWLAAATYLERRHRERWGRPAPIQVNIDQSKTVQITHVEYRLPSHTPGPVIEGESRELPEGEE